MTGAKSMLIWAVYMTVTGLVLLLIPGIALKGIIAAPEPWVRIVGLLDLIIASYYYRAASQDVREFMEWSIAPRLLLPWVFIAFWLAGIAPAALIAAGMFEYLGVWLTWRGLKNDKAL